MVKRFKRSSLIRERRQFFILLSAENERSDFQFVSAVYDAISEYGSASFKSFCLINRFSCLKIIFFFMRRQELF